MLIVTRWIGSISYTLGRETFQKNKHRLQCKTPTLCFTSANLPISFSRSQSKVFVIAKQQICEYYIILSLVKNNKYPTTCIRYAAVKAHKLHHYKQQTWSSKHLNLVIICTLMMIELPTPHTKCQYHWIFLCGE